MGPLYWKKFFALFMRLLRMLNIVLTIISVSTTHTILYCAATATVLSTVLYCTDRTNTVDRWIGITGTRTARVVSVLIVIQHCTLLVQCTTHNRRPFESGGPSPHATY